MVSTVINIFPPKNPSNIFIDDMRFKNEHKLLQEWEFIFIKLNGNPDGPAATKAEMDHESEKDLDSFMYDYHIAWCDDIEERVKRLRFALE